MQTVQDLTKFINNVNVYVKKQIEYIDKILQDDDIESPVAESVEKCYEGLRLIIKKYELLPHGKLSQKDREYIVSDLSVLYHQLDIFKELLQEAIDYDNKRPELAKRRKQAIEIYHKTAEQQQQELALKLTETLLQAEQEKAKNLELSILEERLRLKRFTLEDLTGIFKARLGEIDTDSINGSEQNDFLTLYEHLRAVLLQTNHLSEEQEAFLTDKVKAEYITYLIKFYGDQIEEVEKSSLSEAEKKTRVALLNSTRAKYIQALNKK
jgi:hypothetical protein